MCIVAITPLFEAYFQSDFLGKLIFFSLLCLSVWSWALLIHKMWLAYMVRKTSRDFEEYLKANSQNFFQLDGYTSPAYKEVFNPFFELYCTVKEQTTEVLRKNSAHSANGLEEQKVFLSPADIDFVEAHMQTTISSHRQALEKYLFVLSTVVSLAPFLGLLGTVWGILTTLSDLQLRSAGQSSEMVLGGLSMALATTVLGLVVAIPALVSYNYLKHNLRDFETDMHNFANELVARVEMLYRKVDVV